MNTGYGSIPQAKFSKCCRNTWQIRHSTIVVDIYGHLNSDGKARNGINTLTAVQRITKWCNGMVYRLRPSFWLSHWIQHSEFRCLPRQNLAVQRFTYPERDAKLHGAVQRLCPWHWQHDRHSCKTQFNTLNSAWVPPLKTRERSRSTIRDWVLTTRWYRLWRRTFELHIEQHFLSSLRLFYVNRQRSQ